MPVLAVYLLFGVAATVADTPVDVLEVEVVEVDDGTAMVEGGTEEVDAEDAGADEDGTEEDGTGAEDEKDEEEEDIKADEDVVLDVGAW